MKEEILRAIPPAGIPMEDIKRRFPENVRTLCSTLRMLASQRTIVLSTDASGIPVIHRGDGKPVEKTEPEPVFVRRVRTR